MNSSANPFNFDEFLNFLFQKEKVIDTMESLAHHKISYIIRGNLVKKFEDLCKELGFSDRTFFLTVSLFDRFMKICKIQCFPADIDLIGAISFLISSKFEENQIIKQAFLFDVLLKRKYSLKVLKKTELFILKSL